MATGDNTGGIKMSSAGLDLNTHKVIGMLDGAAATEGATKGQMDVADLLSILKDGTRAFTGDQSMGSHKLTGLTDPALGDTGGAVNLNFVDKMADPNTCSEFYEEFDCVVVAIANALIVPGRGQFFTTLTGTGAVTAVLPSTATELGLFQIKPGTTATGVAFLTHALAQAPVFIASASELYISIRGAVDQLSNATDTYKLNIGLQDTATVAPTNAVVFQHLNGFTNFQIVCTKAGAATTTVDTGVPVDTALHRFEILKADGSTTLRFKIDGNFVDAGGVSTNIPVVGLSEALGMVNSLGGGSGRAARFDWYHRRIRYNTPRAA